VTRFVIRVDPRDELCRFDENREALRLAEMKNSNLLLVRNTNDLSSAEITAG